MNCAAGFQQIRVAPQILHQSMDDNAAFLGAGPLKEFARLLLCKGFCGELYREAVAFFRPHASISSMRRSWAVASIL